MRDSCLGLAALYCLVCAMCVPQATGQTFQRPRLHVEEMHRQSVWTLAFSRGPKRLLATGSEDATIKLYDEAGREIRTLRGHGKNIFQVAFSANGTLLASASEDGTAILWDVKSGASKFVFREHNAPVTSVAFSADGRVVASGGQDGKVRLWETGTGKQLQALPGHEGYVTAVAFHPQVSNLLASGGVDKSVLLWDTARGGPPRALRGHEGTVNSLAFSPGGRGLLASGSGDYTVKLWETESGVARATLKGHEYAVNALVFNGDGSLLASCGKDAKIKLWKTETAGEPRTLEGHSFNALTVDFSADGLSLASAGSDEKIKFWDVATGVNYRTLAVNSHPFNQSAVSGDGRRMAVGVSGVRLWQVGDAQSLRVLRGHGGFITGLSFSGDGRWLATASEDGTVKLWDAKTGKEIAALGGHRSKVVRIAFSFDGRWLASVADDEEIKVWDARTHAEVYSLPAVTSPLSALAFSRGGETLALGYVNGDVRLLRAADGRRKMEVKAARFTPAVSAIALSDDGRLVATGDRMSSLSKVKLRDAASGDLRAEMSANGVAGGEPSQGSHGDDVLSLAFSEDGKRLYSTSSDATVKAWGVAEKKELYTFRGHDDAVRTVTLLPGGRLAMSGSVDGEFVLWRTENGVEQARLVPVGETDWLVATPDGLFDGSARAWRQVLWRFNNDTFDYASAEAFFGDFYSPGLFRNLLDGKTSRAPRDFTALDRRPPKVSLKLAVGTADTAAAKVSKRDVEVEIAAEEASGGARRGGPPGEVRDLRLFRNGSLVKVWRGQSLAALGGLEGCRTVTPLEGAGRRVLCRASVPLIAGENRLTAYAFNRDNVKSEDAELPLTGDESLARPGVLYVLAVGVDRYANTNYDLSYAAADATEFGRAVKAAQERNLADAPHRYSRIEVIPLLDAEATKQNILLALKRFAGADTSPVPLGHPLERARRTGPEDAVFIYFAGHGKAVLAPGPQPEATGEFYLIPHDMGYAGPRVPLAGEALELVKRHSISSQELRDELGAADAGLLVLIIDACNSGQALEMVDPRQGPMNSRGLAQLAYEKGMYVLTASQGYQSAKESARLGHGLLTYALVVEGLSGRKADEDPPDERLTLREWLDFAARRVPELQAEHEAKCRADVECVSSNKAELVKQLEVQQGQRPRVFYRRDTEAASFVVASLGTASAVVK